MPFNFYIKNREYLVNFILSIVSLMTFRAFIKVLTKLCMAVPNTYFYKRKSFSDNSDIVFDTKRNKKIRYFFSTHYSSITSN